jgi:hypothetical protein
MADPGTTDPGMGEAPVEEKDQDTLLQEHVTNNLDKYKAAFEDLFPTTQMQATNVEYRGAVTKDKVRVVVDFQVPLLNFDALQVLADKEIGIEATGEKTFKVYNIYLPRVKDSTIDKKES